MVGEAVGTMIVTVAEAGKLWCPMATTLGRDVVCIGSQCAAWRWVREPAVIYQDEDGRNASDTLETARGYCGLAGRP